MQRWNNIVNDLRTGFAVDLVIWMSLVAAPFLVAVKAAVKSDNARRYLAFILGFALRIVVMITFRVIDF